MLLNKSPSYMPVAVCIGLAFIACLIGLLLPGYVDAMEGNLIRLAALPALILLAFALALSRKVLFITIMLFRGAGEVWFDSSRFSLGGYQIGLGGLINGFAILIALLLIAEKPLLLQKKLFNMWAVFLIVAILSLVISPVVSDAVRLNLQFLSTFAVFIGAFYLVRKPQDFKTCIRVVLFSSILPVCYAFYELSIGGIYSGEGGLRLQGTFTHPNVFAFYLLIVISVLLYMLKSGSFSLEPKKKWVLNVYMLILLGLLVMTQTRSAWVACFLMFAAYGFLFERRYLVYIFVLGSVGLLIPGVMDRLLDATINQGELSSNTKLNSFAWRMAIWGDGLEWMRPDHYLLGYGLASFKYFSATFSKVSTGLNMGAHNVYVQLLFELGVIGLLAFLWMFTRLFVMLKAMISFDKIGAFVLFIIAIDYLVVSASDNMLDYLSVNWYFWFIVGAAFGLVGHQKSKNAIPKG